MHINLIVQLVKHTSFSPVGGEENPDGVTPAIGGIWSCLKSW